jgi:glycosyltransferase involved in cell wall biosynthesis
MKLMMLCTSDGYGGLELYAAEEVQQLQARGYECLPVVSPGSMLDKRLQEFNLKPAHCAVMNHRMPLLAAKRLARLIDDKKIDLIHIHWNNDLNLAVLAKRFSRRRPGLVYSRHMAITRSKKDPFHRWFYQQVDRLIVITHQMQKEAEQYLPLNPDQITRLYLGVAEVDESPAPEKDCFNDEFPRRKLNLGLFGRIEPYKGQHLLIEAVEKLVSEGCDISATIYGHVMDEKYYADLQQRVANAHLAGNVRFESFVKQPAERMKCYDVIALTTYCETFGLVLLEAMHAGIAVIGSRCGGVPEIITEGETGILFTPGSVIDLASGIKRLYDQPDWTAELGIRGKQVAREKFSEKNHFKELENILLEAQRIILNK